MDLKLDARQFLVGGASSGLGRAVAEALLDEGATVLAVARSEERLRELQATAPDRCRIVAADITADEGLERILGVARTLSLDGLVVNAGGPPVGEARSTGVTEWDTAYRSVFRWKAGLVNALLPAMVDRGYGRILFIESQSVKQPIPGLAQSNAMRAAVAGYAKTLATELARSGITVNILAPGSHDTGALERVIRSRAEAWGVDTSEARKRLAAAVPMGRFGRAEELASLVVWLLCGHAGYVTGQVVSHDGGNIAGLFG